MNKIYKSLVILIVAGSSLSAMETAKNLIIKEENNEFVTYVKETMTHEQHRKLICTLSKKKPISDTNPKCRLFGRWQITKTQPEKKRTHPDWEAYRIPDHFYKLEKKYEAQQN